MVLNLPHSPLCTEPEESGFHISLLLTRSHLFLKRWLGLIHQVWTKDLSSLTSDKACFPSRFCHSLFNDSTCLWADISFSTFSKLQAHLLVYSLPSFQILFLPFCSSCTLMPFLKLFSYYLQQNFGGKASCFTSTS